MLGLGVVGYYRVRFIFIHSFIVFAWVSPLQAFTDIKRQRDTPHDHSLPSVWGAEGKTGTWATSVVKQVYSQLSWITDSLLGSVPTVWSWASPVPSLGFHILSTGLKGI